MMLANGELKMLRLLSKSGLSDMTSPLCGYIWDRLLNSLY